MNENQDVAMQDAGAQAVNHPDIQPPTAVPPTAVSTSIAGSLPMSGHPPVSAQEGVWVPLDQITVPDYSRDHDPAGIDSLSRDLDKNGQLHNAILAREGEILELVVGKGRYLAAKKLNWEKIRADIKTGLTKSQKLMMAASENTEREDASPFYTAQLWKMIKDEEKLDQRRLAERLGKDETVVSRYLSLADLDPQVQENLQRCKLGIAHCVEIAKLPKTKDQLELIEECNKKGLPSRALQAKVKKLLKGDPLTQPLSPEGGEGKNKAEEGKPFRFAWKGNGDACELAIKAGGFRPGQDMDPYVADFKAAFAQFLADHPAKTTEVKGHAPAEPVPASVPEAIPEPSSDAFQKLSSPNAVIGDPVSLM